MVLGTRLRGGHNPGVRRTSLASRFLVTLLVTCVLPLVVFGWFTLRGVRELIDAQLVATFVPRLATDHARKIDDRLRQIFQSCSLVREMARDALEQVAAGNEEELVDFGSRVALVPDLLDNYLDLLMLVDNRGEVVYWRDGARLDPTTRAHREAAIPGSVSEEPWFARAQEEQNAFFLPWGRSPLLGGYGKLRSRDPADYHVGLVIDVPRPSGMPGVLLALIRWPEIQELLDETRRVLVEDAGLPSAQVFVADADGVIQGHTDRDYYGRDLQPLDLRTAARSALSTLEDGRVEYTAEDGRRYLCGFRSFGEGENRSWTIGLSIPVDELFAATDAFARVTVLAIAVTLFVLAIWALVASRAIVRPVKELVQATGRVAGGDLSVRVPALGGPELGELAESFNQMAEELAVGRERLALAERERAWAEMARQIAHEIKNPLTPMRMTAQLLLRARRDQDPRADAIAERLARTVEEQTEALARIATDFRHFAGVPDRVLEPVPLDGFLSECLDGIEALHQAGQLTLQRHLSAGTARVRLDAGEFRQVLVNLLENSTQAAAAGVVVEVASELLGDAVVLTVVDDGPGVPEPVLERLFEPYFTTKTSGTGLGLAICRRIVEAHGGSIDVLRSSSAGTAFQITLPVAADSA